MRCHKNTQTVADVFLEEIRDDFLYYRFVASLFWMYVCNFQSYLKWQVLMWYLYQDLVRTDAMFAGVPRVQMLTERACLRHEGGLVVSQ
jgi:hypothetical protein